MRFETQSKSELKDFIHIERQFISIDVCDRVIEHIKDQSWSTHQWHTLNDRAFSEKEKELSIVFANSEMQSLLSPIVGDAALNYVKKYSFSDGRMQKFVHHLSRVRFNRYCEGEMMRQHYDHIHSLFDGYAKGIPVLSFVLNFNDDYEGANLYFWKDYEVSLGKGDIIMFPSVFMYPHGVTETLKGTRYSAVVWGW